MNRDEASKKILEIIERDRGVGTFPSGDGPDDEEDMPEHEHLAARMADGLLYLRVPPPPPHEGTRSNELVGFDESWDALIRSNGVPGGEETLIPPPVAQEPDARAFFDTEQLKRWEAARERLEQRRGH